MTREKTHWCNDQKHNKCGGYVQYIKSVYDNIDLSENNFDKQTCLCRCHKINNERIR